MKHPITQFRIVALAEGISFLVLLGIAMPLKYYFGQPSAVRVVGSIHGGLFVLYILTIYRASRFGHWSIGRIIEAVIASLLPFGPLFLEYKHKAEFAAVSNTDSEQ